jgi:hypothetical protein
MSDTEIDEAETEVDHCGMAIQIKSSTLTAFRRTPQVSSDTARSLPPAFAQATARQAKI